MDGSCSIVVYIPFDTQIFQNVFQSDEDSNDSHRKHCITLYSASKSQQVAAQYKQFNTLHIISEMLTVLYHTALRLYSALLYCTVLYFRNKTLGIYSGMSVKKGCGIV